MVVEWLELDPVLCGRMDLMRRRRRLTRSQVIHQALTLWCELELLGQGGRDLELPNHPPPARRGAPPQRERDGRPAAEASDDETSTETAPAPGSPAPNSEQADLPRVVRPRSRPAQTLGLTATDAGREGGSGRTQHRPV